MKAREADSRDSLVGRKRHIMAMFQLATILEGTPAVQLSTPAPITVGSMRGPCSACQQGGERALAITPSKGLFMCFACPGDKSKHGAADCIALVAHIRGVSQLDAAKLLKKHFCTSGTVPTSSPAGTAQQIVPGQLHQIPADTRPGFDPAAYAAKLDPLHASLASLGISPVVLTAYKAGYASSGLLRGRLAIPMHDLKGAIVGFCGRALDESEPRLLFPRNFNPQSVVFNGYQVHDTDFAYLCTDPLAVLRASENGVDNVVAALGVMNSDFLQTLSLWMDEHHVAAIEPM
jgi:hypothetical protein